MIEIVLKRHLIFFTFFSNGKRDMLSNFREKLRQYCLLMMAIVMFLLPVGLPIDNYIVSANYSFVLLLAFLLPYQSWPTTVKYYIIYVFICYFVSFFFHGTSQSDFFYQRQFLSFLIALAPLLLACCKYPFSYRQLQTGILIASGLYAIAVITAAFLIQDTILNVYEYKYKLVDYIADWPQRYIIVLVLAVFIGTERMKEHIVWLWVPAVAMTAISISGVLTAQAVLVMGLFALFFGYLIKRQYKGIILILLVCMCTGLLSLLLSGQIYRSYLYGYERILNVLGIVDDLIQVSIPVDAKMKDTSFGSRVEIWGNIAELMLDKSFWFGSGFAGVYLFLPPIGSAHSQYFDVFLRSGPIGLVFFLLLWIQLLRQTKKVSIELTIGLLTWCLFGLTHETLKYPHAAFIFFVYYSLFCHAQVQSNEKLWHKTLLYRTWCFVKRKLNLTTFKG